MAESKKATAEESAETTSSGASKGSRSKADGSFGYQADDEQQLHSIGFYLDGAFVPVASCTYGQANGHVQTHEAQTDEKATSGKDGE